MSKRLNNTIPRLVKAKLKNHNILIGQANDYIPDNEPDIVIYNTEVYIVFKSSALDGINLNDSNAKHEDIGIKIYDTIHNNEIDN